MYRYFVVFLFIVSTASIVWAEPFQINVTEPTPVGTLERTCFYYCTCNQASTCTCTNWQRAGSPHCIESDGSGGDVLAHSINIPIYEGDLPVTVRYTATTVNTSGNETMRGAVADTHTFTAP